MDRKIDFRGYSGLKLKTKGPVPMMTKWF